MFIRLCLNTLVDGAITAGFLACAGAPSSAHAARASTGTNPTPGVVM